MNNITNSQYYPNTNSQYNGTCVPLTANARNLGFIFDSFQTSLTFSGQTFAVPRACFYHMCLYIKI